MRVRLSLAAPLLTISMLTTPHLLVGSAIGKATVNIYLTILLAFFTHYIFDAIPHYNPKPVKNYLELGFSGADKKDLAIKSIEPVIGIALTFFILRFSSQNLRWPIAVGAFFAFLPDFLLFLKWKYGIKYFPNKIHELEKASHWHSSFLPGIMTQLIVSTLAIWYLLK